jgi:hypothetical protein
MVPENNFFGHDLILFLYSKSRFRFPIFGYLNHAWFTEKNFSLKETKFRFAPIFLINDALVKKSRENGILNCSSIGSPFLYLLKFLWPRNDYPMGNGTLILPTIHDEFREEKLIETIQQVMRTCEPPYTIRLKNFSNELEMIDLNNDFWSKINCRIDILSLRSEPNFLIKLAFEIAKHSTVVGNEIQTGLIYAAAMGKKIKLVGPRVNWQADRIKYKEESDFLIQKYPELLKNGLVGSQSISFGREELGWNNLLSPKDLRKSLGWNNPLKIILSFLIHYKNKYEHGKQIFQGKYDNING